MTTETSDVSFQYSYTMGRSEVAGDGLRIPVSVVRGEGDLLYVLNRGYPFQPQGKRITAITLGEEYVSEFGRGCSTVEQALETEGSMVWPSSLALDQAGNVYVSDEELHCISIFTKDGGWVGTWGTRGDGDGELDHPSGLAFDGEDNLLVVDTFNSRIQKFTKDGKFLAKWGAKGSGDGELDMPWGIDIDGKGDVYVADWRNDRIQKFSSDGRFLMKISLPGSGDGELSRPTGVAVDDAGIVYVTDWGNDRVQVFGPGGKFITKMVGDATMSKWGKDKLDAAPKIWKRREVAQGMEREKLFWGPIALDVDGEGRLFVVETCRHRVQVYRKIVPYFTGVVLGG